MSKFCSNCGSQMEDQATFCPNCGAANEAAPAPQQAPAENKAAAVASEYLGKASTAVNGFVKKAKKNPKALIVPAVILVAVIAVIAVIGTIIHNNGYKGAIDAEIAVLTGTASKSEYERQSPEDVWEYMEKEYEEDLDDRYDEYEEYAEELADNLEDEYGKNYKITYKITDKDELSKKKLKELKEDLNESYDLKKSDVKKAYKLDIEWEIKGSEDDDDGEWEDVIVYKYGGKWYVYGGLG